MTDLSPIVELYAYTFEASAAIPAGRFVKAHTTEGEIAACAVNEIPIGVSREAIAINTTGTVDLGGIVNVEAGGAIAVGDLVKTAADGKAAERDGVNPIVGVALTAAAADGDFLRIKLFA